MRQHFYVSLQNLDDWRQLHKPEHWKDGFSAKQLAARWHEAKGFPAEVSAIFKASDVPAFRDITFLVGFPEFQVELPPPSRQPSQIDIMVLAHAARELVIIAVEGKNKEPFGDYVRDWRSHDTQGKTERLASLIELLGLEGRDLDIIRYQLLHRTASALLTAKKFGATHAVVLVHSFSPIHAWFDDYSSFLQLFGLKAARGSVQRSGVADGVELYFCWAVGDTMLPYQKSPEPTATAP